ncbi:MAG TPA: MgtC/SapB family protein [Dehalococcoidia bacterium]|jgi:putative Mg2+ transporter-C (MgtC) family protein|nr:MgtC/SapB family protein [Dehalococcoidia bacterium]
MHLGVDDYLLRLGAAFVLGSIVGLERERQPRPAGLRTHMLVCVGSALVIIVSTYGFNDVVAESGVVLDPSRIAAQVVTGIGFIGAGTIIANPDKVRGLTTAASLWAVAGIGLAAGAGLYGPAIAATVLVMIILVPFKYVEGWLFHRQGPVDD